MDAIKPKKRDRKYKHNPGSRIRAVVRVAAFLMTAALTLLTTTAAFAQQPDTVQVGVYQNGKLLGTYTIREAEGWMYKIPDMPKYDDKGKPYEYEVKEIPVAGYETSIQTQTGVTGQDFFFIVINHTVESLSPDNGEEHTERVANDIEGEESFGGGAPADGAVSGEMTEDTDRADDADDAAGETDEPGETDEDAERDDMWLFDGPISRGNLPNTGVQGFPWEIMLVVLLWGALVGASAFAVLRCRKWE